MSVDSDKGRATLRQAVSNRDFAEAVLKQYGPDAPNTQQPSYWCHIIAQSQQAVEKSIKSLCIVNGVTPRFSHDVTRHVVAMLKRPEHVRYSREIYSRISRLFSPDVRGQITNLCQLAPRHGDDRDQETLRNTEYAYQEKNEVARPGR